MKTGARIRIALLARPPRWVRRISGRLVWRIETRDRVLYLTFDDGPVPGPTEWVLDQLSRYGAAATFFCVGENVKRYPELFARIKTEGHGTGNHTMTHLNSFRYRSRFYVSDVFRAHRLIGSALFRPPYGRIRPSVATRLFPRFRIVLWDILSMDYDRNLSPETVLDIVMSRVRPGSIIVFHDNPKAMKNLGYVLPEVLSKCTAAGYKFLPLHPTLT